MKINGEAQIIKKSVYSFNLKIILNILLIFFEEFILKEYTHNKVILLILIQELLVSY